MVRRKVVINADVGLQSQPVSVMDTSSPLSLVLVRGRGIEAKAEPLAAMPRLIRAEQETWEAGSKEESISNSPKPGGWSDTPQRASNSHCNNTQKAMHCDQKDSDIERIGKVADDGADNTSAQLSQSVTLVQA